MQRDQTAPPVGFCQCGCGRKTRIALSTDKRRGRTAGEPLAFVHAHQHRRSPVDYLINPETGCWEWQLSTAVGGYGILTHGGCRVVAHRRYFERRYGPIGDGLEVHHRCHNPSCVNPDHLEVVTTTQHRRLSRDLKLTIEDVREIRRIGNTERQVDLARRCGVSQHTISKILRHKIWREAS